MGSLVHSHHGQLVSNAMSTLAGKIAVVTGSGGGIGRGICSELAVRGATIAAVDIDTDRGKASLDAVRTAGGARQFLHG